VLLRAPTCLRNASTSPPKAALICFSYAVCAKEESLSRLVFSNDSSKALLLPSNCRVASYRSSIVAVSVRVSL
jgi:hypothetical protein